MPPFFMTNLRQSQLSLRTMIFTKFTLSQWLSSIMIFVLITMASIVFFSDWFQDVLPGWKKTAFVAVTLAYASLRFIRIRKQIQP